MPLLSDVLVAGGIDGRGVDGRLGGLDRGRPHLAADGGGLVLGGAGSNRISLGGGSDAASGGNDADEIDGGEGADTLYGDDISELGDLALVDRLPTAGGNDRLAGGGGGDKLFGMLGDDVLSGGEGDDTLDGGRGPMIGVSRLLADSTRPPDAVVELARGSTLICFTDGLTDAFEKLAGTDPTKDDSDADGFTDGHEAVVTHTDPLAADTDDDGAGPRRDVAHRTPGDRHRPPPVGHPQFVLIDAEGATACMERQRQPRGDDDHQGRQGVRHEHQQHGGAREQQHHDRSEAARVPA